MCKNCDDKEQPCCWNSFCIAADTDNDISNCECCGAEMQYIDGAWYHHDQYDNPTTWDKQHTHGGPYRPS